MSRIIKKHDVEILTVAVSEVPIMVEHLAHHGGVGRIYYLKADALVVTPMVCGDGVVVALLPVSVINPDTVAIPSLIFQAEMTAAVGCVMVTVPLTVSVWPL
jgi:hypothetical protein